MKNFICLVGLSLLYWSTPVIAEISEPRKIGQVQVTEGATYVRTDKTDSWFLKSDGSGPFVTTSCPSAYEAYFSRSNFPTSYDDILAQVMYAKATNTAVQFYGTCGADANFITITGIYVK